MSNLKELANAKAGDQIPLSDIHEQLQFNADGLIPAIAQQFDSGQVLMMAWMNADSLQMTLTEKQVIYWSRSRQKLWRKGETSGQTQTLKSVRFDCDGDTLLLSVDQKGPACHTGRESCFFFEIDGEQVTVLDEPVINPKELYKK